MTTNFCSFGTSLPCNAHFSTRSDEGLDERVVEQPGLLKPRRLYIGDNGRVFCGSLRCAGMTAYYTKRDLSGQRVAWLPLTQAKQHGIKCETCGMPHGSAVNK